MLLSRSHLLLSLFTQKSNTRPSFKNGTTVEEDEEKLAKEASRRTFKQEPDVLEFDDEFDLLDDEQWGSVPQNHTFGRFNQYRQIVSVFTYL